MRVLKYLFLILLLLAVATSILIGTQKGDYQVTVTCDIPLQKKQVVYFLNDFYNWDSWFSDAPVDCQYSTVSTGKGAIMFWDNNFEDGSIQTLSSSHDSLRHQMLDGGKLTSYKWFFKQTKKQTTIQLTVKGQMNFGAKLRAVLQGGPTAFKEAYYTAMLSDLRDNLIREITKYSIKIEGVYEIRDAYFIGQSIVSTNDNIPYNVNVLLSKMNFLFEKNNLKTSGKPFVDYLYIDPTKGISKLNVCIPVFEEIWVSPESDVITGKSVGGFAIKTTLRGDYSHISEAVDKTKKYLNDQNLKIDSERQIKEIYLSAKPQEKRPSRWITEIYVPIIKKSDTRKKTEADSLTVQTVDSLTVRNTDKEPGE